MKHAVYLFYRRSDPGLFVCVSCAVELSVFADLTEHNVPARCTLWMGYRTPDGRRFNRKVAVTARDVNFVSPGCSEPVLSGRQILRPTSFDAAKRSYLDEEV